MCLPMVFFPSIQNFFFFLWSCIYQSFMASQFSLRKDFLTHIIRTISHVLIALLWFYFHIGFIILSRIYFNVRYKLGTHSFFFFPSVQPVIPNGLFPIDLNLHHYYIIHCFYFWMLYSILLTWLYKLYLTIIIIVVL